MQIINELSSSLGLDPNRSFSIFFECLPDHENRWIDLYCQIAGINDWRYLLRIQYSLLFIMRECINQLKVNKLEKSNAVAQTINVFNFLKNEYYRRHPESKRKVLPTPPSFRTAAPRYAFLASANQNKRKAYMLEVDIGDLSSTFKSISREVLEGLIVIENKMPLSARKASMLQAKLSWSARLLISKKPDLAKTSLEQIVRERTDAITAFEERHAFLAESRGYRHSYSREKISGLAERFIERHLNNLNLLVTRQVKIVPPRNPLLSGSQKAWLKRNQRTDPSTGYRVSTTSLSSRKLRDAAALGIAPSELEAEFLNGVQPGGYLHHRISNAVIYKHEEAVAWSRDVPCFSTLGQIYQNAFNQNWEQMTPGHRLAVFRLLVHLHAGILPELLDPIRVGNKYSGRRLLIEDGIYLDIDKKAFVHLLPVQIDPETLLASSNWKDRGLVEVPLPSVLKQMLRDLLRDFPPSKSGERWIPAGTEMPQLLPKNMSALKLIDAFERFYAVHYGCEPEIASLVAGMPVLKRASSAHYFRTTYERLRTDYHRAFGQFHSDLITASGDPRIAERLPKIRPNKTIERSGAVGSLFYPNLNKVSLYLCKLRERLEQIQTAPFPSFIEWREVLNLYAWEALKIVTGMRVTRHPSFNRFSLLFDRFLYIQDKGVAWRIVPIHRLVVDLYKMLSKANRKLQNSRMGNQPRPEREDEFFIDYNGHKRSLNQAAIISTAAKHGIKYPKIAPNAYRHLMRSFIHQKRRSHRIADCILGHTQSGPSAMDRLSTIPLPQVCGQFLPVVDELLKKLGVSMVADWRY
jgi:hypothetical protein